MVSRVRLIVGMFSRELEDNFDQEGGKSMPNGYGERRVSFI